MGESRVSRHIQETYVFGLHTWALVGVQFIRSFLGQLKIDLELHGITLLYMVLLSCTPGRQKYRGAAGDAACVDSVARLACCFGGYVNPITAFPY